MTQDQYGQASGPGYVGRGDAVPEDETGEFTDGQSKPMTRFQKVASALRGGTEQDQAAADEAGTGADARIAGPDAPAGAPDAPAGGPSWVPQQTRPEGDYWDKPGAAPAHRDEAVAVTSPDVPVAETGPDAADHPATEPDMFGTTSHAGNETTPANGARRHAAGTPADDELRPGEAPGTLGDFSDLTYGNLIPDAAHYSEQWQQIQFRFVDDPHASVTEAADIVAQVTAKMEAAIQERQRAIEERQHAIAEQQRSLRGRWGEDANADTEALRETLRMYKTFLDQLIGPKAS